MARRPGQPGRLASSKQHESLDNELVAGDIHNLQLMAGTRSGESPVIQGPNFHLSLIGRIIGVHYSYFRLPL
jgi:hypothetical protein